jgi:hypothetical protein
MATAERENTPESTDLDSTWSNAPKLSRKVRELAQRSFHALKTGSDPVARTQAPSPDILQDLRDLRAQLARLQQKIHSRKLGALIPWIDALIQQVDDRLGHPSKEGE